MNWQPIETAPKDGKAVLAFWSKSKFYSLVAFEDGYWVDSEGCDVTSPPTHWMPLPEPPA